MKRTFDLTCINVVGKHVKTSKYTLVVYYLHRVTRQDVQVVTGEEGTVRVPIVACPRKSLD